MGAHRGDQTGLQHCKLVLGMQSITSPVKKEPEPLREVKQYQLDVVELTSTHSSRSRYRSYASKSSLENLALLESLGGVLDGIVLLNTHCDQEFRFFFNLCVCAELCLLVIILLNMSNAGTFGVVGGDVLYVLTTICVFLSHMFL